METKGPKIEEVQIDPNLPPEAQKQIISAEVENAKKGRAFGLLILLLGIILTLVGATGVVDLKLSGFGLNANVAKAGPGVVLMLIGLAVIALTNLKITTAKKK